jgi:hypothetical protein
MDDQRLDRARSSDPKHNFQFSLRAGLIAVTCIAIWSGLIFGRALDTVRMMPSPIWESWVCFAVPALICLPVVAVAVLLGKSRLPLTVLFGTTIALLAYRWLMLTDK